MSKEKKLTDEEIVKAFNHCANNQGCIGGECPLYNAAETDCVGIVGNLLNRLQSENAEQKEEIERLTERLDYFQKSSDYHEGNQKELEAKNAELQKQVDELTKENKWLTKENEELYNDNTTLIAGSILQKEQVEKDTANEIYQEIDKSDILVVETQEYGEIEVVPMERLKEIIKSKGAEVE